MLILPQVETYKCFRPGDIVLAKVVSFKKIAVFKMKMSIKWMCWDHTWIHWAVAIHWHLGRSWVWAACGAVQSLPLPTFVQLIEDQTCHPSVTGAWNPQLQATSACVILMFQTLTSALDLPWWCAVELSLDNSGKWAWCCGGPQWSRWEFVKDENRQMSNVFLTH